MNKLTCLKTALVAISLIVFAHCTMVKPIAYAETSELRAVTPYHKTGPLKWFNGQARLGFTQDGNPYVDLSVDSPNRRRDLTVTFTRNNEVYLTCTNVPFTNSYRDGLGSVYQYGTTFYTTEEGGDSYQDPNSNCEGIFYTPIVGDLMKVFSLQKGKSTLLGAGKYKVCVYGHSC